MLSRSLVHAFCVVIFACAGESNQTSREVSSGTNSVNEDTSKSTDSEKPSEDEVSETDLSNEPVEVSGSFLVCTPTGSSDEPELAGVYGCGLRDEVEKNKIESNDIRDNLRVSYATDSGETVEINSLNRETDGTPWHVIFTLTGEELDIATKVVGEIEIGGESLRWEDLEYDQDDPDIADELETFRLDPATLEQIKELVGLLLR